MSNVIKQRTLCGHFGHINLNVPVLHPLYHRLILSILKCICFKCSRLLLSEEKLVLNNLFKQSSTNRFHSIVKYMDKIDVCSFVMITTKIYFFNNWKTCLYDI